MHEGPSDKSANPYAQSIEKDVREHLQAYCDKNANALKSKWVIESKLLLLLLDNKTLNREQIQAKIVQAYPDFAEHINHYFTDGWIFSSNINYFDHLQALVKTYADSDAQGKTGRLVDLVNYFATKPRSWSHDVTQYFWDNELADGLIKCLAITEFDFLDDADVRHYTPALEAYGRTTPKQVQPPASHVSADGVQNKTALIT